jgi:hypothetical protein
MVTRPGVFMSPPMLMPVCKWPIVCADPKCHHIGCNRWREEVKRLCFKCEHPIAAGSYYRQHRNERTGNILLQEHLTCPERQS